MGLALLATAVGGISDADAQKRSRADQEAARKGRESGQLLAPDAIQRRYVPPMERDGASYLGFLLDGASGIYTLKFRLNGKVIWIYVDGQSGKFLGRSGG